ncbi:MAG: FHA domain-containing protein [Nitrosospira sp.]|nr:FHA domain-containing protein [Nitrosospira sp.]
MSDKSKPGGVSKWWKQVVGGTTSDALTRYCDKGHPMDPNWSVCAYCDAESRANQKTATPNTAESDDFESNENMQRSKFMERGTTKIDSGLPDEPRGTTKIDTGTDTDTPQRKKSGTQERKITGVLVTFSWRFQGELFVLYEGRNVIGSAASSDIQITTDPGMSGEHAVILCRAGRDELHDLLSTNGTFLNEKYVARDGADLVDGGSIKTGGTVFEFRKITSGGDKVIRRERQEYEEGHSRSRGPGETAI